MAASIRKQLELASQQTPALGTKQVFDIPLTADLERVTLALSGTVNLTAAATNLIKDGICELISSVELIKDGSETLVSLPFSQIVNGNLFRRRHRNAPTLLQPLLTLANQPFSAVGTVDLSQYGALRRKETAVRETDCKTLQLIVTYNADFSKVFNGGTITTSTLSMIAKADELVELPDATGGVTTPSLKPNISCRDEILAGAVSRQRFRLTPNQALRGLTVRASTALGVNSDAVLSKVYVTVGTQQRFALSAAAIRADNLSDMQAVIPTGYYYLDFAEHGAGADRLNDCYNLYQEVLNGADAYVEFDSSAAGTLNVAQYGLKRV
jgi:hypothetical protein